MSLPAGAHLKCHFPERTLKCLFSLSFPLLGGFSRSRTTTGRLLGSFDLLELTKDGLNKLLGHTSHWAVHPRVGDANKGADSGVHHGHVDPAAQLEGVDLLLKLLYLPQ